MFGKDFLYLFKQGGRTIVAGKQLWTAGRDVSGCPGKFRWCSLKLQDFLKDVLQWKTPITMNSCVYLDLSDDPGSLENPKLATDDCQAKKGKMNSKLFVYLKRILRAGQTLWEAIEAWPKNVFLCMECQRVVYYYRCFETHIDWQYLLEERTAFTTDNFNKASFKMKVMCLSNCLWG